MEGEIPGSRLAYNLVGLSNTGVPFIHGEKLHSLILDIQVTKMMFWPPLSYSSVLFLKWFQAWMRKKV